MIRQRPIQELCGVYRQQHGRQSFGMLLQRVTPSIRHPTVGALVSGHAVLTSADQ